MVVAKAGVLINVPSPARFALHKLVTLERRSAGLQAKALKDLAQAQQLLEVLLSDRPGDLRVAREAADEQPPKFQAQLGQAIKRLPESQQRSLREFMG